MYKKNSKLVLNPKKCFLLNIHYEVQQTYNQKKSIIFKIFNFY
jgi:hypothetical protein